MKFLKSGWFKFIIFLIVIICISVAFYFKEDAPVTYRTSEVFRGDIESSIDGSGVIIPSESRKVYSKVSSEITKVLHEEGEFVNSGDVLFVLDSSNYKSTVDSQMIAIEQAKLSLNNIKKQINDLTILANSAGYVSNLTISEGSYVTNTMQICDIIESNSFEIVLPFMYSEVNPISIGNTAKISLIQNFADLSGTVTKVSEMRKLSTGSSQVIDVTIRVDTTGYSLVGAMARGEIIVNGTRSLSTDIGTFTRVSSNIVRAKTNGTVKSVNVYEGKYVNVGDVIAVLSNDDLNTSLENANLTLKNLNNQYNTVKDQLDNYTIKAPISGTITVQGIKVGDMVGAGSVLSTISNNNVLEFKIPVDELDIAKLDYNQEVRVSIDALEETSNTPIIGKITNLPLEGTSTAGVTEYYVTIQIPGEDKIRISMSANAEIITSSQKDVLMVPIDVVTKENGESYVDILLEDNQIERRSVELGSRNISYVEVKSGLNEGDKVIIPNAGNGLF